MFHWAGAGFSSYRDVFPRISWNLQNILTVEQLWTTSSKLFIKTSPKPFCIFSWNFLFFFVWIHFTCFLSKTNILEPDFEKQSIFFKTITLKTEVLLVFQKYKKGDPTKIKWKKVPSKVSEIPVVNVWFAF